jgi:Asp-tRNA(Asn)/Glu-tRNA(Gln) amidotransferase B subunit
VPQLSIASLAAAMLDAVKASLDKDWPKARDFAKPELQRLARSMADIVRLIGEGKVTNQQAKALLEIHRNTSQIVLLTIEGLGIIAVQNALNAAVDAVRTVINRAAGFALL